MTDDLALAVSIEKRLERFFRGLLRDKAGVGIEFIIGVALRGAQVVLGLCEPTRGFALWVFHKS